MRSRSSASYFNKNSPQLACIPRSSSNSVSKPSEITPPSRKTLAGSDLIARASNSEANSGTSNACLISVIKAAASESREAWISGSCNKLSRKLDKSLGLAVFKAIRVVMRSISPTARKASLKEAKS